MKFCSLKSLTQNFTIFLNQRCETPKFLNEVCPLTWNSIGASTWIRNYLIDKIKELISIEVKSFLLIRNYYKNIKTYVSVDNYYYKTRLKSPTKEKYLAESSQLETEEGCKFSHQMTLSGRNSNTENYSTFRFLHKILLNMKLTANITQIVTKYLYL